MGTEMIRGFKKMILPIVFFATMLTFYFDFVLIERSRTLTGLTGFNLLKSANTSYDVWMTLVFVVGLVGFIISWFNGKIKYGVGFLLALAGVILLLVAQFSIIGKYTANNLTVTSKMGFWVCLATFVIEGRRCYLLQFRASQKKEMPETKGVVNINIIKQRNKDNEK